MTDFISLTSLGWQAFFQQQLSLDEWENADAARVIEQHKSTLKVATEEGHFTLNLNHKMPEMTVGDWLLLRKEENKNLDNSPERHFLRLLDRKTSFSRKAAGSKLHKQLISANVDTAFILCSMNEDFNLNRIERFLSLVHESSADVVVILSKSNQASSPQDYIQAVQSLDPLIIVEAINCLDHNCIEQLSPWIKQGNTIAVLGSSGVGKSTLTNTLLGKHRQETHGIREQDSKGRHTTTSRSLMVMKNGGLILDTPGMREIQLTDSKEGISTTFADIEAIASKCRFSDCQHQGEPDCAIEKAISNGALDLRRLANYQKLLKEDAFNSANLAERRANDKALGKYYKTTQSEASILKGR
ncbi:ribosome small subunit-dependent GTPase A [Marinomonas sp. PE14-40]|uniref:ribosome small subunit-dependent GTPase A n=1 Tax=Marinomonas sp. PE14-40 TaxID=3060621 RepID=UPI003F66F6D6